MNSRKITDLQEIRDILETAMAYNYGLSIAFKPGLNDPFSGHQVTCLNIRVCEHHPLSRFCADVDTLDSDQNFCAEETGIYISMIDYIEVNTSLYQDAFLYCVDERLAHEPQPDLSNLLLVDVDDEDDEFID